MRQIRGRGSLLKGRLVATTAAGVTKNGGTGTMPRVTTPAGITSLRHANVDNDENEQSTTAGTTGGATVGMTTTAAGATGGMTAAATTTAGTAVTGTTTTAVGTTTPTAAGATG